MSLDNIQLSPGLIQQLYGKSLYDVEAGKTENNTTDKSGISFLGDNQKKIIILVSSEASIYLPDDELNFLLGILTACRLTMADIALINVLKNNKFIYSDLTEQLKAEKVFLFGLQNELLELPLAFPQYQIQKYGSQVYLSAASLADLQKEKDEKMKLWNCLKKVFEL